MYLFTFENTSEIIYFRIEIMTYWSQLEMEKSIEEGEEMQRFAYKEM